MNETPLKKGGEHFADAHQLKSGYTDKITHNWPNRVPQ